MNIIEEIQDSLKDLPDNALMQEMQMPTGSAPQFPCLSELKRRKRMRDEYQHEQNADMRQWQKRQYLLQGCHKKALCRCLKP